MKPANVVNQDQIPWTAAAQGKFRYRRKAFTAPAGMQRLGASIYELEPGASAYPRHYHCANEEAIFVLEGAGTIILGEAETPVRTGDLIALPRGVEHAHRLTNSSQRPLRYLCFSTMIEPDVAVYSDSNKVGFFAGSAPGGPKELRRLTGIYRRDSVVGYFDGEPDAWFGERTERRLGRRRCMRFRRGSEEADVQR
jgi:uncharacterized cupin superfamily protein